MRSSYYFQQHSFPCPRSFKTCFTVFFVDRGDLMLFAEVQGQQRLLSVQEGYELMVSAASTNDGLKSVCHNRVMGDPTHTISSGPNLLPIYVLLYQASCSVTMERYLVYAHLMRSGYLVMR